MCRGWPRPSPERDGVCSSDLKFGLAAKNVCFNDHLITVFLVGSFCCFFFSFDEIRFSPGKHARDVVYNTFFKPEVILINHKKGIT